MLNFFFIVCWSFRACSYWNDLSEDYKTITMINLLSCWLTILRITMFSRYFLITPCMNVFILYDASQYMCVYVCVYICMYVCMYVCKCPMLVFVCSVHIYIIFFFAFTAYFINRIMKKEKTWTELLFMRGFSPNFFFQ